MDSMVSHMSVSDWGGNRPYPMHSMCDIALNSAHEYCSSQNACCKTRLISANWQTAQRILLQNVLKDGAFPDVLNEPQHDIDESCGS